MVPIAPVPCAPAHSSGRLLARNNGSSRCASGVSLWQVTAPLAAVAVAIGSHFSLGRDGRARKRTAMDADLENQGRQEA